MTLDGAILADGTDGGSWGGGSGGGVNVRATVLRGAGLIQAQGGNGEGGGGGGRVAVWASDLSGFDTARITAHGASARCGTGTVYLRDTDQSSGTLIIAGLPPYPAGVENNCSEGSTPLNAPGQVAIGFADRVVISGLVSARVDIPVEFRNGLEVRDWAQLIASTILADTVSLRTRGRITSPDQSDAGPVALDVRVTGILFVDSTGSIDVSRKGYLSGLTDGNLPVPTALGSSGGSLGGRGGGRNGVSPETYGDPLDPDEPGGGGPIFPREPAGTAGGGVIRIHAGTLLLNGSVVADGLSRWPQGGSGAGGSIFLDVDTLSGTGRASACGGYSWSGGTGGGGRIAVYYRNLDGFDPTRIQAAGNNTAPDGVTGQPGTVHLVNGVLRTHVRTPVPAGINGGYHDRPIGGSVTLRFNRAIDVASFDPTMLTVAGQMGTVRAVGVTEVGDRTYRFDLDRELTEDGGLPLQLVVGPARRRRFRARPGWRRHPR